MVACTVMWSICKLSDKRLIHLDEAAILCLAGSDQQAEAGVKEINAACCADIGMRRRVISALCICCHVSRDAMTYAAHRCVAEWKDCELYRRTTVDVTSLARRGHVMDFRGFSTLMIV